MALVKIAAGAELDLASGDELAGAKGDILSSLAGKSPPVPLYLQFVSSGVGAGAVAQLNLGSPPAGRVWNILSITVVGGDDHTAFLTATQFAVYIGPVSLSNLANVKNPAPGTTNLPTNAVWCHANENVYIQTDRSLAVTEAITAILYVAEWRVGDVTQIRGD